MSLGVRRAMIDGDTLVITALARLGRSTQDMLAFVDELRSPLHDQAAICDRAPIALPCGKSGPAIDRGRAKSLRCAP